MSTALNTEKAYTSTETVPLPDCNEGDLIVQHCGIFRLANRRDWDDGDTVTFDGVYVGRAFSDTPCNIPAHWRENKPRTTDRGGCDHGYWQVQGNRHARVARITDSTRQYYHGWADEEHGRPDWRDYPVSPRFEEEEKLANGARVLERRGDTVLAQWRNEYVTWRTDDAGNAHWGHYHGRALQDALNDFNERTAS